MLVKKAGCPEGLAPKVLRRIGVWVEVMAWTVTWFPLLAYSWRGYFLRAIWEFVLGALLGCALTHSDVVCDGQEDGANIVAGLAGSG